MARPLAKIEGRQVERAAAIGCTVAEISVLFGCDKRTLERRFAASIEKGRERGKKSLRRMQWKTAKAGNPTMQIWLGKQLLSQADKVSHTGADGGPIRTEHEEKHTVDYDQIESELSKLAVRMAGGTGANGRVQPVHPG